MRLVPTLAVACLLAACATPSASLQPRGLQSSGTTLDELSAALQPRRVAVLIGVDEYVHPLFTDLQFAGSDARSVAALLEDEQLGGFDRVLLLDAPDRTNRDDILRELRSVRQDVLRQDIFVLYFSGHGTLAESPAGDGQLYLLPRDADPADLEHSALRLSALREFMGDLPSERKTLIVDACFHGDGKSVIDPDLATRAQELAAASRQSSVRGLGAGEAHLFASTLGLPAFEDERLGRGVYTHYLLQAMTWARTDADLDADGLLTVWEAHDYARARAIEHTNGAQVPEASLRVVGANDLVLVGDPGARRAVDRALVFDYGESLDGATLVIDGRAKGVFPGTVAVDPGRHHVEVRKADGSLHVDGYATFEAGRTLRAGDLRVQVREDRAMAGVRAGVGGGPAGSWGHVFGSNHAAVELWGGLRVARGKGRGLLLGGTAGLGFSPARLVGGAEIRSTRPLVWFATDAGWGTDLRRLRLRFAWQLRLTVVPVAKLDGADHEPRAGEAGWVFGSMGPMLHVGLILDRRTSLVAAATLQGAPLDLDGTGRTRLHPFGIVTAGLELGF